ncbi:related to U-box domain protein [Ramularia collo-cygni]|uniref:Related to U-box domain protein n=1 Tax=Ramularia collo-cygni TaxID=112498 RepID=A0A2D3UQ07_9PEZI|nr:related to U-box domain protein [Ramularia collo-cygni]CZT17651.1 related to U-box domain protein [Ramularia collo-cygni]
MASYAAEQLKEKGNAAFRNGDYQEAEDLYTQAVQRYSRNPLIFTNRANVRLKLQKYDAAVNDCLKSIEITGASGQNHKAFYFLAQAQLALHHPHEALSSALTAYGQVLHPSPAAKISPLDLQTFSAFVLKCKKAKFSFRDRERLRRQGDMRAEFEDMLETTKQSELVTISQLLHSGQLGQVEAFERSEEIKNNFATKFATLRSVFEAADPKNFKPKEIPDHLIDMITFEPMHDPVMTKNGHSYERSTIFEHLKRSSTDPLTREPLTIGELRPNFGLKAACDEFWESGASEWVVDW